MNHCSTAAFLFAVFSLDLISDVCEFWLKKQIICHHSFHILRVPYCETLFAFFCKFVSENVQFGSSETPSNLVAGDHCLGDRSTPLHMSS